MSNEDEDQLKFVNRNNPIVIQIHSTLTGEFLGVLFERNGELCFEGKADEAAQEFMEFVCILFKQRIDYLISKQDDL